LVQHVEQFVQTCRKIIVVAFDMRRGSSAEIQRTFKNEFFVPRNAQRQINGPLFRILNASVFLAKFLLVLFQRETRGGFDGIMHTSSVRYGTEAQRTTPRRPLFQ
jgi:hypothetical protein